MAKKIAGITIELSADTTKMVKAIDKVAKDVTNVGKELTKNVTAPLMAIGGASVAAFKSVDEGFDTIIKKTGATGEELEGMKDIFKDLAGEVPASMTDIGSAIGEVNTRFGLTGDELETLSGQFLKFAQLNGTDVSGAIDSTQKALAAFGESSEYASEYLDVLNKVGQQTGISVDTLNSGLVQNSAAFQEMGLNLEQAAVFMGQIEVSGADTSTVMGSLSRALKNATAEGKPLNEALAELEDSIVNGTGDMDGLTASYELFGKSGAQVYNAVKNGTLSFKDLGDTALDAGGSVSETFDETLDPLTEFKLAMQELQIVGAELGTSILSVLSPAIQKLSEFIQMIRDKWNGLSPQTQDMIVKIGLIAAAIGPVLMLIGKVISVVSTVIAIGSKLKLVFAALTGPIGLVVAAIAAAIAIGVALYKNWDTVKAKAQEIWNSIAEFLKSVWDGIKEVATTIWDGIKLYYITLFNFFKTYFTTIWNGIKTVISGIWNGIKTQAQIVWNAIKMAVTDPIGALKYFLTSSWENIKSTASRVWQGIKSVITAPITSAVSTIRGLIDKVKGFFPIRLSNIFSGFKLPHIKIQMQEGWMGIKYPKFSVDWYKKAYDNAMRFTSPTVLATSNGLKGFGDGKGAEWVVGENSLMSMIQRATANSIDAERIYQAVKEGASQATIQNYLDGREMTQGVNRHNTIQQMSNMRFRGAI